MEKTAVQWLIEQLNNYDSKMIELFKKEISQAKEMEKQHIIDAFDTAKYLSSGNNYNGEKYYKDTFSN